MTNPMTTQPNSQNNISKLEALFSQTLGCSIKEAVKKIDEAAKAAAEKRVKSSKLIK